MGLQLDSNSAMLFDNKTETKRKALCFVHVSVLKLQDLKGWNLILLHFHTHRINKLFWGFQSKIHCSLRHFKTDAAMMQHFCGWLAVCKVELFCVGLQVNVCWTSAVAHIVSFCEHKQFLITFISKTGKQNIPDFLVNARSLVYHSRPLTRVGVGPKCLSAFCFKNMFRHTPVTVVCSQYTSQPSMHLKHNQ